MKRHVLEAAMYLNELGSSTGFCAFLNTRNPTPVGFYRELPKPKQVKPGSVFINADGECHEAQGGDDIHGAKRIVAFKANHHALRA